MKSNLNNKMALTGECVVRYRCIATKIAVPRGEARVFTEGAGAEK